MSKNRNPDELGAYLDNLFDSSDSALPEMVDTPEMEVAVELMNDIPPQLESDMRSRMLEKVLSNNPTPTIRKQQFGFPSQSILRWAAVFAVFIILMSSVTYPAVAYSLPGDVFYPLKIGIERIEIELATTDSALAFAHVLHAERRLDEAQKLLDANTVNSSVIRAAIDDLKTAQNLVTDDPSVSAQIMVLLNTTNTVIEKVANHDESEATTLKNILVDTAFVIEDDHKDLNSIEINHTPTQTATVIPSVTPTLTVTPSPNPTATATLTVIMAVESTEATGFTTSSYEPYIAVVSATANVNIRDLPTEEGNIVDQAVPGTIVSVVGESIDGQWVQIAVDNVELGWVASFLVIEGTVPQFTIQTDTRVEETSIPEVALPITSDTQLFDTDNNSGASDGSTNQGNDGVNKFGCDGQGNSCNSQNNNSNGNSGNNNSNGNGNKKKNK